LPSSAPLASAGAVFNIIVKAHRAAPGQEVSFIVVLSVQWSEKVVACAATTL
jgi:hypothetical protein